MNAEISFLSLQDVLNIHQSTIANEGGHPGIRDIGLIESAVVMPQQAIAGEYLHPDLASMAAAYLFHLTSNHGFVDGNKRVGLSAAVVFLLANGVTDLPPENEVESATRAVASGKMTKNARVAAAARVLKKLRHE